MSESRAELVESLRQWCKEWSVNYTAPFNPYGPTSRVVFVSDILAILDGEIPE